MDAPRSVWQNLRHWALHICLNASGSFATAYVAGWRSAQAIVGMIAGVVAFILLYTWIWSSPWFHRRVSSGGTLERALLYATRLRSTIGVCGFLGAIISGLLSEPIITPVLKTLAVVFGILFLPDGFAGLIATNFIEDIGKIPFVRVLRVMVTGPDPHQRAQSLLVGDINSLVPTFLLTMMQGFLLSLILLAFAWLFEVVLRYRARRRQVAQADTVAPSL